ncbi:MAG: prepilin-type N-terminal cleavage/methylation domain-containing protein [Planctomycetota bacterium]
MNERCRKPARNGFTLIELLIVLVIISAMVGVILPYASRSNENLRIKQECLNIAETVNRAIDLAVQTERSTRVLIDSESECYWLEIANETSRTNFQPVDDPSGNVHYLGKNIHVTDTYGFNIERKTYCLVFDPANAWPNAVLSLASREEGRTIRINGKQVEIEESSY